MGERVSEGKHPDTLKYAGDLAMLCLREEGRLEEAEELGLYIVETSRSVQGTEHPESS